MCRKAIGDFMEKLYPILQTGCPDAADCQWWRPQSKHQRPRLDRILGEQNYVLRRSKTLPSNILLGLQVNN